MSDPSQHSLPMLLKEALGDEVAEVRATDRLVESAVASNVAEVYIGYLRQKIDAPFGPPLIHTVRGVGYTLRAPAA